MLGDQDVWGTNRLSKAESILGTGMSQNLSRGRRHTWLAGLFLNRNREEIIINRKSIAARGVAIMVSVLLFAVPAMAEETCDDDLEESASYLFGASVGRMTLGMSGKDSARMALEYGKEVGYQIALMFVDELGKNPDHYLFAKKALTAACAKTRFFIGYRFGRFEVDHVDAARDAFIKGLLEGIKEIMD